MKRDRQAQGFVPIVSYNYGHGDRERVRSCFRIVFATMFTFNLLLMLLPRFMGVMGVYAAEALSDATAAICCTLIFFWRFPKILGRMKS